MPKKTGLKKVMNLRLDPAVEKKLAEMAAAGYRSKTAMVTMLIEEAWERQFPERKKK